MNWQAIQSEMSISIPILKFEPCDQISDLVGSWVMKIKKAYDPLRA